MSERIVMATGNPGKLAEIRELLSGRGLTILPQSAFDFEPAEETGETFLDNAMLKAEKAAEATGLPAIADDSGLAVEALQGAPGVRSARYAGAAATDADNIAKLLAALQGLPETERAAAFHCVVVAVWPGNARPPLIAEGIWRGRIAVEPAGGGGFGYDPVFVEPVLGCTAAEMTSEQKNARSHRGQAFRELARLLSQ